MTRPTADGVLVLNKTKGVTSMDMVRLAKRVSHVKRVGHAGTLDPIATGVLPICFGQATRLMEFLVDGRKIYKAEFKLGSATDTYDATGEVTETGDASSITREDVEALIPVFTGALKQQPPMYSAVKHEGQRLYDLARAGVEVERPARDVVVHKLTILDWASPFVSIEVECGRGFYMRTFGHDLGVALGCYAHLTELQRTKAGPFTLEDCLEPQQVEDAGDTWEELLMAPDAAVQTMDAVSVPQAAERHLRNGQPVTLPAAGLYVQHLEARRAYSTDGRFLAIVRFDRAESQWKPERVFNLPVPSPYAPV